MKYMQTTAFLFFAALRYAHTRRGKPKAGRNRYFPHAARCPRWWISITYP